MVLSSLQMQSQIVVIIVDFPLMDTWEVDSKL